MKIKMAVAMLGLLMLTGCGGVKASIAFTSKDLGGNKFITGSVRGRLSKVQEFRSLLEAVEYRTEEKPR